MTTRLLAVCAAALLALAATPHTARAQPDATASAVQPADLVIENARIWSDGLPAFARFAAVRDGRFVHVGEPDLALIGPDTARLDAQNRVVIPGLIDSHIHMLGGGAGLAGLQLRDAADRGEFVRRVGERAGTLRPGEWITGGRWSTDSWGDPTFPDRSWIDEATPNNPALISRMDGHSALANSLALQLAEITRDSPPDPPGGVIDRDADGNPTGILRESAVQLVARLIPGQNIDRKVEALRAASAEAAAHGITAVGDIPGLSDLPAYERLAGDPALSTRFFLYPTADDWRAAAMGVQWFEGRANWVQVNGFKAYLDGTLGSRTAYMSEPFLPARDGSTTRGLLREGVEGGAFREDVQDARRAGVQVIAHAIGDAANDYFLDTLEEVYGTRGPGLRDARARAEHAQHLSPAEIARFGSLGVVASMQPLHKADDGRYAEAYIGPERCRTSYAFKDLLDAGAVLVFGSDWPVVSLNPWLGIDAAVTGRLLDSDEAWMTHQNITIGEALRCYTSRAAYALRAEDEIGKIEEGYRADFVVLSDSPFDPAVDLRTIRAMETYVEGRLVYRAP
ncbi:MAG: amidohydrolase family protein [Phycisphaerales bacterium]|nr:amidohydrolase family protein [Phycisphaerales bacterium]MCB9840633.1 amidohydrolase family protein [Phycisphaeraceae bacterium]